MTFSQGPAIEFVSGNPRLLGRANIFMTRFCRNNVNCRCAVLTQEKICTYDTDLDIINASILSDISVLLKCTAFLKEHDVL